MSKKSKGRGRRYTASEKARAMQLYEVHGPSVTARRLGIPYETIRRWARDAGVTKHNSDPTAATAQAHAVAAQRASRKWAEFREAEADAAGEAAVQTRERLLDVLLTDDHQMIRAVTSAYDSLITNAEKLSNQASQRIAVWAEQDIDAALRQVIKEAEDAKRDQLPASKKMLLEKVGEETPNGQVIDTVER